MFSASQGETISLNPGTNVSLNSDANVLAPGRIPLPKPSKKFPIALAPSCTGSLKFVVLKNSLTSSRPIEANVPKLLVASENAPP